MMQLNEKQMSRAEADELWQAVINRDRSYDGEFFLAVKTTGIFCRPICPARKPRRENVLFFDSIIDARRAGFRACKKCHPERGFANQHKIQRLSELCQRILEYPENAWPLKRLAGEFGMSPAYFQKMFKNYVGISPQQFIESAKIRQLKFNLKNGVSIAEATFAAGYNSSSRLYEKAVAQFGMTPSRFQKGGAGVQMLYAITRCDLGLLLVAATERGISAVYLGESENQLEEELRNEYPHAELTHDAFALAGWSLEVIAFLSGEAPHPHLPLDVRATAFQRRVWQKLMEIPYGETKTYKQLATALGNSKASRAVGRACATNPVSLLIPCHRAIREHGGLAGFRWGLERKEILIAREKAIVK